MRVKLKKMKKVLFIAAMLIGSTAMAQTTSYMSAQLTTR